MLSNRKLNITETLSLLCCMRWLIFQKSMSLVVVVIHSVSHSFFQLVIHSFMSSFLHYVCLFWQSFIHLVIHSSGHSSIQSFLHSFACFGNHSFAEFSTFNACWPAKTSAWRSASNSRWGVGGTELKLPFLLRIKYWFDCHARH